MLRKLVLQNFRNYSTWEFEFFPNTTLIVGPNAVGKTNILEAIYELATGKSFRAEDEQELVQVGPASAEGSGEARQVARVVGELDGIELEIDWDTRNRFTKTYKVNGVGKRVVDFTGLLRVVLFEPQDIEIVADSPSTRRRYLDQVLALVHRDYRVASHVYERALRQRNKLLWKIREFGIDGSAELDYWDDLLINNGKIIHQRRKEYLDFLNGLGGDFFPIWLDYDHSVISKERLEKYRAESVAAAATLVGPHRDDFQVKMQGARPPSTELRADKIQERDIRSFGSRGEQRMAVFTLKLGELEYVSSVMGERPTLLLDDIFSELDHENRHRLLGVIPKQQTIMTTTDLHLVEKRRLGSFAIVDLK